MERQEAAKPSEVLSSEAVPDRHTMGADDIPIFLAELSERCGNDPHILKCAKEMLATAAASHFCYTAEDLIEKTMEKARVDAVRQAGASLLNRCMR